MPLPLSRKPLSKNNKASKAEPIAVTDPNDKRLRAYNDSNQSYKNFIDDVNYQKSRGAKFSGIDPVLGGMIYKDPTGSGTILTPAKKPVQPVILQKPTVNKPTVKKQTATAEQIKPLDRTPKLNKPERVELSMKKNEVKESSEKTEFKQGRKFMKETGLRPGFYKEGETSDNSNKKIPIKRR